MIKDHCARENFFQGLHVKIKNQNNHIIEGKVEKIKTTVSYDPWGIYVALDTGDEGNTIEIIQTDSEKIYNQLISEMIFDLEHDENERVDFKETFAYPVDPEKPLEEVTKSDKKFIRFLIGKAIASFANASGGTVYIGIQDGTKKIMGLERDFKLLDEGERDADGLLKKMKSYLPSLFGRENKIFEVVKLHFVKFEKKDICIIKIQPSPFAFVLTYDGKNHYFIRQNDSSNHFPDLNSFLDYWTQHIKGN